MLCARLFYDFPQPKFWMLSGNLMYSNRRRQRHLDTYCFVDVGFASRCLVENHSGKAPRSQRVCSPTRARRVYHSVGIKACAAGPQELRKQLLDLVDSFGRLGGKNQSAVDDIEDALSALLSSRGSDSSSSLLANDLDPSLTAGWEERLEGRWNLRYSTEGPLLQLMTNQALPFLSTGQVYQLFRGDGTLQNVVEFDRGETSKTVPAVLSVGVDYVASEEERRCDFQFKRTKVMVGQSAMDSISMARGTREDQSPKVRYNLDVDFPFAVGKGYFHVVWLDQALRVDRDTSNGKNWLNIYVYGGPTERCTAV